jgi:hypothetical protein
MKKLLILNNNLHIGGVQKALVNLLKEISKERILKELNQFVVAGLT